MANEAAEKGEKPKFDLVVNRVEKTWPKPTVTGSEIKTLAGSPADYIVNQKIPGPGDEPEIGDTQEVQLDHKAEPRGIKKFTTRKPKTTPGA